MSPAEIRVWWLATAAVPDTALSAYRGGLVLRRAAAAQADRHQCDRHQCDRRRACGRSLTHTRGFVAVAVTLDRDIAEMIATPRERQALRRLAPDPVAWQRALMQLWVEKEAFAKALGFGHSLPLASVAFDAEGRLTVGYPPAQRLPEPLSHS